MAWATTWSAVIVGVQAHLIETEAHLASGLPGFTVVGLPDPSVSESRDRVRAAIVNSGLKWPDQRITVGLSPASLPKHGAGLDLAVALAILAAAGEVPPDALREMAVIGELSLDGRVRVVPGMLASAVAAFRAGLRQLIVPRRGADQAALVPDMAIIGTPSLRHIVAWLRDEPDVIAAENDRADLDDRVIEPRPPGSPAAEPVVDLADVRGQEEARLALEIAAAGGHHLALLGRAGVGKTLLAERLPGLLPDLEDDQALDVTSVQLLAGRNPPGGAVIRRPPWCAPHHTASRNAVIGGGSHDRPSIGLVCLADHGVLFLDEAPEFEPSVLDALRQPLESGAITLSRAGFSITLPARFQLVIAANPCPCGLALDTDVRNTCRCTPHQRRRYTGRLSGPLLDRVDLRVLLQRPTLAELSGMAGPPEGTARVADRVLAARERMTQRLAGTGWRTNAQVPGTALRERWPADPEADRLLTARLDRDSARGRDRVLRTAWTVADLGGRGRPSAADMELALHLREGTAQWAA